MKTLKIILALTLLLSVSTMALTLKVKEPNKKLYTVLEGTTVGQISKTGLAVDIAYKSTYVDVGEISDVNITLNTGLNKGVLNVNIRALDNDLDGLEEQDLNFNITEESKSFSINLQVSSSLDGIHYINVTLSVEGEGSRVLAVPVNVGEVSTKIENNTVTKASGNNQLLSISEAEEEIQ